MTRELILPLLAGLLVGYFLMPLLQAIFMFWQLRREEKQLVGNIETCIEYQASSEYPSPTDTDEAWIDEVERMIVK